MPETISPFRDVWVTLGKLRERLELSEDADVRGQGRQLALEIHAAEKEWQIQAHGPSEN